MCDIHHIEPRSSFGSKRKDEQDKIENLIGLCRECHNKAHGIKGNIDKKALVYVHLMKIKEIKGIT